MTKANNRDVKKNFLFTNSESIQTNAKKKFFLRLLKVVEIITLTRRQTLFSSLQPNNRNNDWIRDGL
jgi:hypothetical protein